MCSVTSHSTRLSTWVPEELKRGFRALAESRGLSDSALLKQLVEFAVIGANPESALTELPVPKVRGARLTIRLVLGDRLLLRDRAAGRGMRAATYVSTLIRAHLRSLSPLPDREIAALDAIAHHLGAMGRNVRAIALAASPGGLGADHVRTMLKLCEGTRDHVRALLDANTRSWEEGA
jgi:hypothetical protein